MPKVAEEIVCADDRPGDQLREEADVQRVVDGIAHRFLLAAVHVDDVRHALKGVEADAERQHDVVEEGDAPAFPSTVATLLATKLKYLKNPRKPRFAERLRIRTALRLGVSPALSIQIPAV